MSVDILEMLEYFLFKKKIILLFLFLIVFSTTSFAFERRQDQFKVDFGYFLYPIYGRMAGIGNAYGAGATIINVWDSDLDMTLAAVGGDINILGGAIFNIHLIPEFLLLHGGYYTSKVPVVEYNRGNDSSKDVYMRQTMERQAFVGQMRLTLWKRRIEAFITSSAGKRQVLSIEDENDEEFDAKEDYNYDIQNFKFGVLFDFTDDRCDPRRGLRVDWQRRYPLIDNDFISSYRVDDINATLYLPLGSISTLALNYLRSDAKVVRQASTDSNTLREVFSLDCNQYTGSAHTRCETLEDRLIEQRIALNKYGRASSLGGTQWLRSYPVGRFHGAHARAYGAELRWNLMDQRNPFNIVLMKGIRTSIQFAFFAEAGAVSDDYHEVSREKLHQTYGSGFRLVFSGATVRADIAGGDEGVEFNFFFDYPWSLSDFVD